MANPFSMRRLPRLIALLVAVAVLPLLQGALNRRRAARADVPTKELV